MTPGDLAERNDLYQRRKRQEYEQLAWVVSRIMGAWVEHPPSVDELLGRVTDA